MFKKTSLIAICVGFFCYSIQGMNNQIKVEMTRPVTIPPTQPVKQVTIPSIRVVLPAHIEAIIAARNADRDARDTRAKVTEPTNILSTKTKV